MKLRKCDRCGKIMEKTFYVIDIVANDVNKIYMDSMETAMFNVKKHLTDALSEKKEYCPECIKDIQEFMRTTESLKPARDIQDNAGKTGEEMKEQ